MQRRRFIQACAGLGLARGLWPGVSWAEARIRPTWLSFGLNGPASSATRFPMTENLMHARSSKNGNFLHDVSQSISSLLHESGDLVEFRDTLDFNAGPMLGAALDYENVLSARLGASSFLVLHLIGHGVLLNFDRGRGWKMLSSFPFPVTLLRESTGGDPQAEGQKYLMDAYTNTQNSSFSTAFVKAAKRLAPGWKESGNGFNVRVMSSTFHPDVMSKLSKWNLSKNINATWLGHLASAAACEAIGVPVVPFAENQSLGQFSYMFTNRLVAQNVRLPDMNDIDLRLHITLRNLAREVKFRNQYQRWEVNRMVVIEVKALDDRNEEILAMRFGYQDDHPDTLAREEDLVPARDAHFFDMAIYRGLLAFFSALDRQDMEALAKLYIKSDAEQQQRIERFRNLYQRAI